MSNKIRIGGLAVAGLLFFLSLGFETLLYADDSSFAIGLACLLFGMGYLAWYANFCVVFSGLFLLGRQHILAGLIAAIALGLSLTALTITEVPKNEAGHTAPVIGYGLGFYLWVASIAVLLGTAIYCVFAPQKPIAIATPAA